MSKRNSLGQSNTLFNYFQSPKAEQKSTRKNVDKKANPKDSPEMDPEPELVGSGSQKRPRAAIIDSDSDDESTPLGGPSTSGIKKPKLTYSDSDSSSQDEEEEKKPPRKISSKKGGKKAKKSRIIPSDSDSESDEPKTTSPAKPSGKGKKKMQSYSFEKTARETNKENILEKVTTPNKVKAVAQESDASESNWSYLKLDFLQPTKIRDINKNLKGHADYDERTLYVPDSFLNKQTPALRQWWVLKSKHFDCVLFFKVGKFYELYHMDAVIGVNHIGLTYMKGGETAHSGFPEVAYGRMASSLVEQGFKVARVEQTETPDMMASRYRNMARCTKFDKVVAREICQVTTKATCVYGPQLLAAKHHLSCYMIALAEKPLSNGNRFGVCFIDTSIGVFHMGEFNDDIHYSRLLALFAQHSTGLILTERGHLQHSTVDMLKKTLGDARKETLASNTQFYSAQKTLDLLQQGCYFRDNDNTFQWPPVLHELTEAGSPKPDFELAIRALGACLWYLKDSELDIKVLSMQKFQVYQPIDASVNMELGYRDYMVLDSTTMENLSLLGSTGTLQKTLDFCETAFGKRLLQNWICQPLCVHNRVVERQKAVQELYAKDEIRKAALTILRKLPDLERQVAKIHIFGNKFCSTNHPDGRAIIYEAKAHSKSKINDLISTLNGFESTQELTKLFKNCESTVLKKLTQHPGDGMFPDVSNSIEYFKGAFDHREAELEGKIVPQPGIDRDYDQAQQAINELQQEIDDYLTEQEKFFGCKLSYFGTEKKRFQIEVPEKKTNKVTNKYQFIGAKKGNNPAKRYTTSTTKQFLVDMINLETKRNQIVLDLNRRIFEQFSKRRSEWEQSIHCLMMLDVICAFAEYGCSVSRNVCFPKILPFQKEPYIKIEEGIHPCTLMEDFVPNSTELGTKDNAKIMLLTGPNMGGKSTLMRQVALIVIMAQMGCPVPATSCEVSLVDRIFTRLGARDDILRGQSTFLVELSEASAILQHATKFSFVLLDELGRGTSTHDGCAIATSYVHKLTEIQCRTIFSTHYHTLIDHFVDREDIHLAHMACMAEDGDAESVTLLYQLREGNCPKSFGFSAAKLAGLERSIISNAQAFAHNVEETAYIRRTMCELLLHPQNARMVLESLRRS